VKDGLKSPKDFVDLQISPARVENAALLEDLPLSAGLAEGGGLSTISISTVLLLNEGQAGRDRWFD
jgi:hypothetical protein